MARCSCGAVALTGQNATGINRSSSLTCRTLLVLVAADRGWIGTAFPWSAQLWLELEFLHQCVLAVESGVLGTGWLFSGRCEAAQLQFAVLGDTRVNAIDVDAGIGQAGGKPVDELLGQFRVGGVYASGQQYKRCDGSGY